MTKETTQTHEFTTQFTTHLPALLNARGLTIRELSRRIDYRFDTVRTLYNGTIQRIPVELLTRICAELDCDIGDVISVNKNGRDLN